MMDGWEGRAQEEKAGGADKDRKRIFL